MNFGTDRLSKLFWDTPIGQQIQSQADGEQREKRKAAEKALREIDARAEVETAALVKEKGQAERAFKAAEAALKKANANYVKAASALSGHGMRVARLRHPHERYLLETARDTLHPFLGRCSAEHERMARDRSTRQVKTHVAHTVGGSAYVVCDGSNESLVEARTIALVEAAREAERLASHRAEFQDALDQLWQSLPGVDLGGTKRR